MIIEKDNTNRETIEQLVICAQSRIKRRVETSIEKD